MAFKTSKMDQIRLNKSKSEGGLYPGEIIIRSIFLFTVTWAYNWGEEGWGL